jgi:LysM repeat protein
VLRGLLAAVTLLALVVGVPALLVATIGNPIPDRWNSSAPLTDAALLSIVACVAWVFWTQLVVCVVVETIAELRLATGRSADLLSRMPGTFGGQQALARTLVQAVVAIAVTTTATTVAATPWMSYAAAAPVSTPTTVPPHEDFPIAADADEPPAKHRPQPVHEVTVTRGDTLWSIAESHLGAGERWREIAELNRGREMADGLTFDDARTIQPGWTLLVPSVAPRHADQHLVTVQRGDTLWEIADDAYGDGTKWPRIYHANSNKIENPQRIYPGQHFFVPGQPDAAAQRPKEEGTRVDPPVGHIHPPLTNIHRPVDPPVTHVEPPVGPSVRDVNPPVPLRQPSEAPTESVEPRPRGVTAPTALKSADGMTHHDGSGDAAIDGATLTRALLGGGGFLAAGMFAIYVGRRRTQSRNRRSGKATPPVAKHLRAHEKTLRGIGSSASRRTAFFDAAMRELAATAEASNFELPEVVAARIDGTRLGLRLRTPSVTAPAPWTASPDGSAWSIPVRHQPAATERMSPYPAMVTVGVDEEEATWFIDLEAAGVVQIVGQRAPGEDLARFMAAELALNPWSQAQTVDVVGVAQEVLPLNPGRLYVASKVDVEHLAKTARQMVEDLDSCGRSVLAERVTDWRNAWVPTLCLASVKGPELDLVRTHTAALLDEMERSAGRTSIAFIAVSPTILDHRATTLELTTEGTLQTPWSVVQPNRLTADEAAVLGQLFDDAETAGDVDIPMATAPDGERTNVDQAGALSEQLTQARSGRGDPDSILPRPNKEYVESAATTVEDLSALAPAVPASAAAIAIAADPTLDQDLAEWADTNSQRPKLRVLGPVDLLAAGEKTKEVDARPAYFAELAAYLACHPEGLTPNQVAADFGIQNNTLHTRLGQLRKWLGKKPGTEEWYLPAAQRVRGQQVYRLTGVLSDADLFRRLRARGEARGPMGVDDFRKALELVSGVPYDQQRAKGYGWLVDIPDDHYLAAAIVDVAHVYATHSLTENRPSQALWAAEKAIAATPYEDKPRLDLARAKQAMGDDADAQRYLRQEILNRSDDDRAPLDPSPRTTQLVDQMDRYGDR